MDMAKNRKFHNKASATVLSYSSFMTVLNSVVAYARAFNEAYDVPFADARALDIRRDLQSSDFIPQESVSTYLCYIRVALLCISQLV